MHDLGRNTGKSKYGRNETVVIRHYEALLGTRVRLDCVRTTRNKSWGFTEITANNSCRSFPLSLITDFIVL